MIDSGHPSLSIARQCELVGISRSGFYYQPSGETELNLTLMRLIDEQHMRTPYYGARQMARYLRREGYVVGRKRVRRLMQKMGLCVIYQRPRTTIPAADHEVYPYLLRDLVIDRPNQVWCADITYIPMRRGFLYFDQNVLVVKRCVPLCVRRCSACFGTCPCPVRQWRFTLGGYLANLEMVAGFTWKVLAMARQLSPAVRRLSASAC